MSPADAEAARVLRGTHRANEPMARHTSWRAGGVARSSYTPADADDLALFLAGLAAHEPVCFVGLGSNLLVRDGGYRGTVVFLHAALGSIAIAAPGEVFAEAGVASPKVARFAALNDLVGAEFLAGVPGTVGGALAMNAGCYGGETWRIVARVRTIDRAGIVRERAPEDFRIGYRSVEPACRRETDEWFIAAWFRLERGSGERSRAIVKELLARRIAAQPLNRPNAGSVFRNPPADHAARLIEACGLKGARAGGAEISEKHANFIVNRGGATAADIEALIERARTAVDERFGVVLEREVRIIGEVA